MRPCSRGGMRRLTALRGHDRIRLLSLSVILSHADVAELADALDLGSSAARRMGSTPFIRTILNIFLLFVPTSLCIIYFLNREVLY